MQPEQRLVDKMWLGVFRSPRNGFYAPLACSLNLSFTKEVPTAAVDGATIFFNPDYFMSLSDNRRVFVFMHEVDHVARLHFVRQGGRDSEIWNEACDYEINNPFHKQKDDKGNLVYDLDGMGILIDHRFDDMPAEEIYDILVQERASKSSSRPKNDLGGDIFPSHPDSKKVSNEELIRKVVSAMQEAERSNRAGDIPGYLDRMIERFTRPAIRWERKLKKFMTNLTELDYSWLYRDRRYNDFYLPSLYDHEQGSLAHIIFYYDISGSVTLEQIKRFNTEVAHVHKLFKPEKLTVVTFDTRICEEYEFSSDDVLTNIRVTGGGGTSLACVREHILKHKPSAAVVFSDLQCAKMADPMIPILWGIVGNYQIFFPNYGESIYIPNEALQDDY